MVDYYNMQNTNLPTSKNNPSSNSENTTSNRIGEDITDEIEVSSGEVKIYSINELAPNSAPITIPYMEVMRTNELEYVPYISPYNVGTSSDSSESDGGSGSDVGSSDSSNSSSDDSSDNSSDTSTS